MAMPIGKMLQLIADGAEVKKIKGIGYIIVDNVTRKRRRRTKEEMKTEKK